MKRDRLQTGFTLIELLVVIAIIAILAAILFPVFMNAKVAAQRASCQSNLRQLGSAFSMYVDANGGRMPEQYGDMVYAPFDGRAYTYAVWNWCRATYPYVKSYGVYSCPYARNRHWKDPTGSEPAVRRITYMMNGICAGRMYSVCKRPSRVILLRENGVYRDMAHLRPKRDGAQVMDSSMWFDNKPCHYKGDNFLYADGHIKFQGWGQIVWDARDPMWNFDGGVYPHDWTGPSN
ncbi:MAG: type II secretion system protein [Armatimonadota bacterium]